jgi:hypothetical protein
MIWPCSPPWNDGRCEALSLSAVAGLVRTALSQVRRVIGLGSSWSQPLFAKRPSRIDGSLRKLISIPDAAGTSGVRLKPDTTETLFGAKALFGITPSCSQRRHAESSLSIFQCARTMS